MIMQPRLDQLSSTERRVLSLIGIEEIVSLAAGLVVARGENPPGEEAATVAVLEQACRLRDLPVERVEVAPGRPNLTTRIAGGGDPGLLLLGHSDVVPTGEGWTLDPFGGLVRDGRLWGRGSADMKGGLAACVVALGAIRRSGVRLSGPVELAVTVDEEELGLGVRRYRDSFTASDFAGCVVAEPTELQTIVAARGDCYLEVTVHGRSAHSGRPSDGRNAIYGAARIVAAVQDWHRELAGGGHPLAGAASWSVGQIRGGTGTSIVPAEAVVSLDRRLLPGERAEDVRDDVVARIAALDLAADDLSCDVELMMELPGFDTPVDDPFARAADGAADLAGRPAMALGGWTAACDGGHLARGTGLPVVVLGPGSVAGQAHRADESVPLGELLTASRAYALLALRLLSAGA